MSSTEEVIVTKEQFHEFQELQEEGRFNMVSPQVRDIMCITKEQHHYILKNYADLLEKYGSI